MDGNSGCVHIRVGDNLIGEWHILNLLFESFWDSIKVYAETTRTFAQKCQWNWHQAGFDTSPPFALWSKICFCRSRKKNVWDKSNNPKFAKCVILLESKVLNKCRCQYEDKKSRFDHSSWYFILRKSQCFKGVATFVS